MSITERITETIVEKVAGAVGWLILTELRRIGHAIEALVDDRRAERGLQPLFGLAGKREATEIPSAADEDRDLPPEADASTGDFLREEILTLLAAQQHISITLDTDLVALGKERGWLNQAGEVMMLPEGFGR